MYVYVAVERIVKENRVAAVAVFVTRYILVGFVYRGVGTVQRLLAVSIGVDSVSLLHCKTQRDTLMGLALYCCSMEAKDLIQTGDVFANDFEEYEVIGWNNDGDRVQVENLAGMTEWMGPRELIEVTQKEA